MFSIKDRSDTDGNILIRMGENYEYFRIIVDNKVKLVKLDIAESLSKVFGSALFVLVILLMSSLFLGIILISLAIWIGQLIGTIIGGFLVASLIVIVLMLIIYLLRRQLIFLPVAKFILTIVSDEE